MIQRPPRSTLFPYTTPCQSDRLLPVVAGHDAADRAEQRGVDALEQDVLDTLGAADRRPEVERLIPGQHALDLLAGDAAEDRKSTRLKSRHANISYAVFFLTL